MVKKFEEKISKILGVPYVVCTTSGSMAMLMALMAYDIKKETRFIVPNKHGFLRLMHHIYWA